MDFDKAEAWLAFITTEAATLENELKHLAAQDPLSEAGLQAYRARLLAHVERVIAFAQSVIGGISAPNN